MVGGQRAELLGIYLITSFKYQGNAFLDTNIRPFSRWNRAVALAISKLPSNVLVYCKFERFSDIKFFILCTWFEENSGACK